MPIATPSEACAEFAANAGAEHADRQWILTPWDTWEKNPHYSGAPQRHPEADPECGDCGVSMDVFGWCTNPGCCGLGAATPDGAVMAYQERMAARERWIANQGGAQQPSSGPTLPLAADDWDDMPF